MYGRVLYGSLAGLFLSFYFYHRQVWIYIEDDRVIIGGTTNKDPVGFMPSTVVS